MFSSTRNRVLLIIPVWVIWAYLSTIYYGKFIHDVGATWWFMGIFALPIVLVINIVIDISVCQYSLFSKWPLALFILECALAIALWFTPIVSTGGVAIMVIFGGIFSLLSGLYASISA